jgi:hypothetical protein
MAESLFEARQDSFVVATFEVDDTVGFQAGLRKSRREKIGAGDAPKDLALGACGDSSREKRRRGAVYSTVAASSDLMERPAGKTT